jgi:SAM-dependent methyltransferase
MRVLDLGTGLGHVARAVADLVGPEGEVVGVDAAPEALAVARERSRDRPNVRFVEGDVRTWRDERPFDAVVGRLILFHLPDRAAVVRHHVAQLRSGGRFVALDYDLGTARTEPPTPLAARVIGWVAAAFRSAQADPLVGARLAVVLAEAGLADVASVGVLTHYPPDDPRGPALLGGVARSLAARMASAGIASPEEVGADTLVERLAAEIRDHRAVLVPPALVGAWGRVG